MFINISLNPLNVSLKIFIFVPCSSEIIDPFTYILFLNIKIILVSTLIIVAVISVPIISLPGNDFFGFNLKFLKHALEWDYFIGVISFYLLTFFLWRKN